MGATAMRALRYLAMATLIAIVLVWLILFVAGLPGRLAVVRDDGMEPTVPQGAVMIIPEGGHNVGDVVAWFPDGGPRYGIEGPFALFGIFEDARPARVAPRQQNSVTITFDNRPDEAPLVVQSPGRVRDRMFAYIPFLGYLLWPGPVWLALIFIAALLVLYVTRQRRGSTTG